MKEKTTQKLQRLHTEMLIPKYTTTSLSKTESGLALNL